MEPTGDQLLVVLSTLANPHRMRILASLTKAPTYVSALAREIGISRPLLQVHLRRLEAAGLVASELRLSEQGTAMNYYSVQPFEIRLDPDAVARATTTLTDRKDDDHG
ncbi:ArsR/SmtB family transcription factor [Microbacterium bovistercoris]|nr:winged helix-turn-helix domain-containing protein [Microbacterium bovistercoris]